MHYRKKLGFPHDMSIRLSKNDISKAYKKLCLKEHPDKGNISMYCNRVRVIVGNDKHTSQCIF